MKKARIENQGKKSMGISRRASQSLHLAKSSEIKSISKPGWAIEIYTFRQNLLTGESGGKHGFYLPTYTSECPERRAGSYGGDIPERRPWIF
jgi:hypothetical protein